MVSSAQPSADQIRLCFPRRSRVEVPSYLRAFAAPRGVAALPAVPIGRRLPWLPSVAVGALVPRAVGGAAGSGVVAVERAGRGPRTRSEHLAAASGASLRT